MRDWWGENWPGVILISLLVVTIGTMIVLSILAPERYMWDAADCIATGVRDGVPVYQCAGVPR